MLHVVRLAMAATACAKASSTGAAYPDPITGFTQKRISTHELPPLMRTHMTRTYGQGGKHWLLKGSMYPRHPLRHPFVVPSPPGTTRSWLGGERPRKPHGSDPTSNVCMREMSLAAEGGERHASHSPTWGLGFRTRGVGWGSR